MNLPNKWQTCPAWLAISSYVRLKLFWGIWTKSVINYLTNGKHSQGVRYYTHPPPQPQMIPPTKPTRIYLSYYKPLLTGSISLPQSWVTWASLWSPSLRVVSYIQKQPFEQDRCAVSLPRAHIAGVAIWMTDRQLNITVTNRTLVQSLNIYLLL